MELKYNSKGLIPAIAQDVKTGKVLMMAWMNDESLELTKKTGYAHYYSRSRQTLWKKGETSGHVQKVVSITADCDGDTLLVMVEQTGSACHTNNPTCFFNKVEEESWGTCNILEEVYDVVMDRKQNPKEGSYTNYLLDKGANKICKKVGEEAAEVIIGAISRDTDNVRYEAADLLYHLTVLLVEQGLTWCEVFEELKKRR